MPDFSPIRIGTTKPHAPLGMGGSFYGMRDWHGQRAKDVLTAMEYALDHGIAHFDTATDYGGGESEQFIGRFISAENSRRDRIFLASKANLNDISSQAIINAIDDSRKRLQSDVIDLYYIHWPRTGEDLRPLVEGLETAKQQGKIQAIGVCNFSVEQIEQVSEVAKIDAHQLGYNLLWRFPERDIIPYCAAHDIAVIAYSSVAHGILAGKYERQLAFNQDDQRWRILHFREEIWPALFDAVEQLKAIANQHGFSLVHLALNWLLHQTGVTSVLAGAKNLKHAQSNVAALKCDVDESILQRLTSVSDAAMKHIPDEGNPFGYHP